MKTYIVYIETKVTTSYTVTADSREDALKLCSEGKKGKGEVEDVSEVDSWVEEDGD